MNVQIKRSMRKTLALRVKNETIYVSAPFFVTQKTIQEFLLKHKNWIEKRIEKQKESLFDRTLIEDYKKQARIYIPKRVKEIASVYNCHYNHIKITSAQSRWGSCTSKKNLNFSYRVILLPKEVIDYIICHELAHLKHMNHGKFFWQEVEKMNPDYRKHDTWLRKNSDLYV
ncbi:MAG: M48 family metallopeptidase [Candidatus Gracilibacteria bacterium]|nr:M48 family metallopeptidase [Candidatus Gracilibacteria bacterium]